MGMFPHSAKQMSGKSITKLRMAVCLMASSLELDLLHCFDAALLFFFNGLDLGKCCMRDKQFKIEDKKQPFLTSVQKKNECNVMYTKTMFAQFYNSLHVPPCAKGTHKGCLHLMHDLHILYCHSKQQLLLLSCTSAKPNVLKIIFF